MRAPVFALLLLLVIPTVQAGIEEKALPAGWEGPTHLAAGPGGQLWVVLEQSWALGRFDVVSGQGQLYPLPVSQPAGEASLGNLVVAPDGTVYLGTPTHVVRLFPTNGSYLTYPMPVRAQLGGDVNLAPDGSLWYALVDADRLVRLESTGRMTHFAMPDAPFGPLGIEPDPQGGFYVTGTYGDTLARYDPATSGMTLSTQRVQGPVGIRRDAQGALWVAEMGASSISRVLPSLSASERFPTTPSPYYPISGPAGVHVAPDGGVWFVEHFADRISRLDPVNRTLHEYEVPSAPGTNVQYLAPGPDGAVWFAQYSTNKIGRATHDATRVPFELPLNVTLRAGESLRIPLNATGTLLTGVSEPKLNATIQDGALVLHAAQDASGAHNVLVSVQDGRDTVGRYVRVEVQEAAPAKTPGPSLVLFLGLLVVLARARRRDA